MKIVKCFCLVVLMGWAFAAKASNTCDTLLTFGSGATAMNVCISNEGNIVKFESPAGFDQIGPSTTFRDGYAICSGNLPTFPNVPQGSDPGDVSVESGFGPATVIQPGGANTLPLTIIRNSTSGNYQLTQSFARHSAQDRHHYDENQKAVERRLYGLGLPAREAPARL